ncbi:unnamed protein product [Symbiodinium natans]|uniref:Uncharacterized protein n=1 Tax=Symbiodinium natans TaxID=878477 RepID=A0A812S6T0_9DINO|nr:unnamed protein product [Symbiodinium natans]
MAENDAFCAAQVNDEVPSEARRQAAAPTSDLGKAAGPVEPGCRIMSAAAAVAYQVDEDQDTSPDSERHCQAALVKHALSEAQRTSRRLRRRVRIPALIIGFLLMGFSIWPVGLSWSAQAAMLVFVRDLLRLLGRMSWLCACLPSDRWAPKLGTIFLLVMGIRCFVWHFRSSYLYTQQLSDHLDQGRPCEIDDEEADCWLGAYMIFGKALMFTVMHCWQIPYLIYGLVLPSRACLGRLWVGLALVQLIKGISDFLVLLPSQAVRGYLGSAVPSDVVLYTTLHGLCSLVSGILLLQPSFRRWVYFRLLWAGGVYMAASSVAAFLGNQTSRKVMELAQDTCRFIALDRVTEKDMMSSTPDPALKRLSTPCQLQDIDAFLSHSWQDACGRKWEALQAWRRKFKAQHLREPRLWIDKYCIDQQNIDDSLMCLPVFLASCHTLLIIAGETYFDRLWCMEEVFVYLQMERSVTSIELLPICHGLESHITSFDAENAQCHDDRDRQKLLATIEAGCGDFEAFNIQVQTALLQALKASRWALPE